MAVDFEVFFEHEYERLVRALTFAAGSRSTAEDWTQHAFAVAYRKWSTVAEVERPAAWVYVVAIRAGRRELRRERNVVRDLTSRARNEFDEVDQSMVIDQALQHLSPRQRTVVVMTYFGGLSTAEVASGLRIAPGTVKATLHQARQALRQAIGVSEEDEAWR
jgi:RNA polymerase sigma-70 factor (ECF subfamily)